MRLIAFVACIACFAVLLTACLPTRAPRYTGGLAQEPGNLRPFEVKEAGVRMGIPAGWKAEPASDPADGDLAAKLEKEGTSAHMLVYCQGAFVSRTALPIKPLNLINATTVSNERLWKEQSMGGGNFDPEFSAWKGMVKAGDGSLQPMHFYIAWKLPSSFGCKYALWMIVGQAEAPQVEGDFLAMVRSLK